MARLFRGALALCVMSTLIAGCGGSGGSSSTLPGASGSGSSTLAVALMDAPFRMSGGTVTAVTIDIAKVEAVGAGGGMQTIATFSPSQSVNLLSLQTSPLTLGSAQIPAGTYSQLRLVLDTSAATNNTIVVNGTTSPLTIPSATGPSGFNGSTSTDNGDGPGTAGIKVNVALDAQAGQTYGFLIDFNAAESIVSAGASGKLLMKPVLVATAQALAGAISGTVKNSAGAGVSGAQVVAEQNGTIVNTSVTDASGLVDPAKLKVDTAADCSVVLLRSFYPWKILTPLMSTLLQNTTTGFFLFSSSSAFRTEPFKSSSVC